ncbi:MAG: hypothetical protein J6V55_00650 [Alistipes sp.]|nr:hypothetical protein [Alistipes sp.]
MNEPILLKDNNDTLMLYGDNDSCNWIISRVFWYGEKTRFQFNNPRHSEEGHP